jgi:N-acetylated-alpha-linked acidic dipeptidase
MTESEQLILDAINLDEPWALVESFSTMVREHPRDVNNAADLISERLKKHGIPHEVYEPTLYLSLPGPSSVRVGEQTFRAKAPSYSAPAPDGVTAPLVYVPSGFAQGSEDVFDTLDAKAVQHISVKGRIVVTEGYAMPANVQKFQEWGAAGVIAINPGIDIHWGTCTTVWGTPDLRDLPRKPSIPAVAVNKPDGENLIALAREGREATVTADMEEGWYQSKIPVAEIRGTEEPEKFVLLHGHYDSWDVGVGDNATGDATMLEVARVLWKHRQHMKRTVRIAWWPGHSTGRYAGSTWYADAFAIDLDENCIAQVNCDSPGCRWATEYKDVSLMPETETFAAEIIKDVTGQPLHAERAHQAGDYSFNNIGISSYFMLLSTMPDDLRAEKGYYGVGGCGGNIAWHTENDTLEIADRDILLKDIKIYALAAFRNANAEILPFDWRITAREFLQTVARYQEAAGNNFDFTPARTAAQDLLATLEAFYDAIQRREVSKDAANEVILELARLLVPINFTTEGRFRHDPALTTPPLPDLALAKELETYSIETLGFAQTTLMRGQNRVVSALRRAKRLIEQVHRQPTLA